MRRFLQKSVRTGVPIVVHLNGDTSIAGFLVESYTSELVLRQARYLQQGGLGLPVDGDVVIPAASVTWVQRGVELDDTGGSE